MAATESSLLQAVLQAPDDDTPRLAYAAWCAQQADAATQARARFIHAQLALQSAAAPAPGSMPYQLLVLESEALRREHAAAWAAPLLPFTQAQGWSRGFVDWVRLSARQCIDDMPALFALAPVRHADLTAVRDVDETLFTAPALARLQSLGLQRCGLHDLHVQLLADSQPLPRLRWLSLADNHLTLRAAEALALSKQLPALAFADFTGNPVDPGEQLGMDSGDIVHSEMPPEGQALEARFGPLRWLHRVPVLQRFG